MLKFVSERSNIHNKVPQSLQSILSYNQVFNFNGLRRTISTPKTPYWFYVILDTYRSSSSTDPRDKVFAMLGFLENSGTAYKELIQVDYKNRTVLDAYTDVVEFCTRADRSTKDWPSVPQINSHEEVKGVATLGFEEYKPKNRANGPLNILCASQIQLQTDEINHDFPTWLPDWTKFYGENTIDVISGNRFCASGTEHVRPTFSSDRRLLTVHGFEIAKVEHLAGFSTDAINALLTPFNRVAQVAWAKDWLNLARTTTPRSPPDMQRFWRTLVLDSQKGGWKNEAPESWYDMSITKLEESLDNPDASDAAEYLTALVHHARLRQFSMSDKGHDMMVPLHATTGDSVFIILGCDVPVILRQDRGGWSWIGECFCWGVMNGELVADDFWKQDVQELSLC